MSNPDVIAQIIGPDTDPQVVLKDLKDLEHNIARSLVNTAAHDWEHKYGPATASMMLVELTSSLFLGTVLGTAQAMPPEKRKELLKDLADGLVEFGTKAIDDPEGRKFTRIEPLPGAA